MDATYATGHLAGMTGRELRKWRLHWGLTQNELAAALDKNERSIARWEADEDGELDRMVTLALEGLELRLANLSPHTESPEPADEG